MAAAVIRRPRLTGEETSFFSTLDNSKREYIDQRIGTLGHEILEH